MVRSVIARSPHPSILIDVRSSPIYTATCLPAMWYLAPLRDPAHELTSQSRAKLGGSSISVAPDSPMMSLMWGALVMERHVLLACRVPCPLFLATLYNLVPRFPHMSQM